MLVKVFIIFHLVFIFDTTLSHGDHDDGDQPVFDHIRVCDNGKTGIEIDLSGEVDWKCQESSPWTANQWYIENKRCYEQERAYHVCIDQDINSLYEATIPHSGPHRKVWAQYGEYKYLPPGRYVHNLEHDAVVFMYHPCAPPMMVDELRRTATSCLTRHIITAFANLTKQFPFAVVTYGCVFQMSTINPIAIKSWVRSRFGKSPEPDVYGNGQYNYGLIMPAPERTSYDYSDDSSPFCPDNGTSVQSQSTKVPATPADMSYSDEDFMDSDSFIPYNNDETNEMETADMLVTDSSEISTPVFDLPRDNTASLKIITTTHGVMEQPTESNFPQVVISQKTSRLPISKQSNPLATSAVPEHDANNEAATTVRSQAANPTSFLFIIALAVLLYIAGVVLGCFLHRCYKRNRNRNFRDSKVWRDDDGQGSFNIAAVVRKRPQLPKRSGSYDKYQMLHDDFSDEDSVA